MENLNKSKVAVKFTLYDLCHIIGKKLSRISKKLQNLLDLQLLTKIMYPRIRNLGDSSENKCTSHTNIYKEAKTRLILLAN